MRSFLLNSGQKSDAELQSGTIPFYRNKHRLALTICKEIHNFRHLPEVQLNQYCRKCRRTKSGG